MTKKAEMGIGTLLLFITFILIAAIAAAVVLTSSNAAQEKSFIAGDQASTQVRTSLRVIEVAATNGRTGTLTNFTMIVKLMPGSDGIKLDQSVITFISKDNDTTYTFAGAHAPYDISNVGLTTNETWYSALKNETVSGSGGVWEPLSQDYDGDGTADWLSYSPTTTQVVLNLSDGGTLSLGNCAAGWAEQGGLFPNSYLLSVYGECNGVVVENITLTPRSRKTNKFAVEMLQTGNNNQPGHIGQGDVAKIYFESPMSIGEQETIRISIVPKIGTPTMTEFEVPYTSSERAYLWP